MLNLECTPWAWTPLVLAALISAVAAFYAQSKPTSTTSPRSVSRRFFEGPGLTNSGAVSTVLAMLPILLSADVREDTASASLLGVATLLFSISTFLGVWLYSSVPAQKLSANGETLELTSNRLVVIQAVVVSCMIVAVGCFIAFILVTPLLGEPQGAAQAPKTVILKCTGSGCALDNPHKG